MQEYVLGLILTYKYAIIFPAALFFGPVISLFSGFLLRLEYVELLPVSLALAGGELTGDVVWYWLGRRYGKSFVDRFGGYFGITTKSISFVKMMFHKYHDLIVLLSKLTAGFGFAPAIFFTAGLSHVHFGRYMALNVIGQIVWTGGLLAAGYYLGHFYLVANSIIERTFFFVGIAVALFLIFLAARALRMKATHFESAEAE